MSTANPSPVPRRLKASEINQLRELTTEVLRALIEFRTTHDLLAFVRDEGIDNYTDLEIRLHQGYPVTATAVVATRSNLNGPADALNGGFLHDELPLSPEAISGRLWMYPMEAASAAYAYTLVELHGQQVAEVLRGARLGAAWHRGVNDWVDLKTPANAHAARQSLSKDLNVPASRVSVTFMRNLQALKSQRNTIVHEGRHAQRFTGFYAELLRLVCRLHFVAVPGDDHVVVSPWPDHDNVITRPPGAGPFFHIPG